ncbi:MAG: hypothetical protein ABIP27_17525 [Flavobacterium circumlabens]|uniref:hypothetical protein n=1 Tax=Flavobacterium circumlabens TaxID=2133765 RepID=UPI003266DB5A
MKKLLLIVTSFIALFSNAQDFKNISTRNDAIAQATILASKSSNSKLLNSYNFVEDNLFAVRFVTPEMSGSDYDKLDSMIQNRYLSVVFKMFDDNFVFSRATGSYDVIFEIWKNYVFQTDKKDNQNKKYFDKDKKILYLLSEDNDERWKITRQIQ